jgi:hypothetical protein
MKKFNLLILASLMLTIVSCGSNNEPSVEKFKNVSIEVERSSEYLSYLEENYMITLDKSSVEYNKSDWSEIIDNQDGVIILRKMGKNLKDNDTFSFKQKNVAFQLIQVYHTKPDVSEDVEDSIEFDTNIIIKVDGKVVKTETFEFKTGLNKVIVYPK